MYVLKWAGEKPAAIFFLTFSSLFSFSLFFNPFINANLLNSSARFSFKQIWVQNMKRAGQILRNKFPPRSRKEKMNGARREQVIYLLQTFLKIKTQDFRDEKNSSISVNHFGNWKPWFCGRNKFSLLFSAVLSFRGKPLPRLCGYNSMALYCCLQSHYLTCNRDKPVCLFAMTTKKETVTVRPSIHPSSSTSHCVSDAFWTLWVL